MEEPGLRRPSPSSQLAPAGYRSSPRLGGRGRARRRAAGPQARRLRPEASSNRGGGRRRLRWSLLQPGAAAALATPLMRGRQAEQRPAVARAGRKACCWLWWIWRAWRRWAERWWSAAAAALPVGYATVRSGTVQSQAVGESNVVSVASTYA